jgi:hypothetical protein
MLFVYGELQAQTNHSAAIANADTSRFSVNKNDGWQIFNSYVTTNGTDSILFDVIIQHDKSINWQQEQYIGRIKEQTVQPGKEQVVISYLMSDQYQLRILKNGKCYLRLFSGSLPADNPVILPLRFLYKK